METLEPRLYVDPVDPLSFFADRELRSLQSGAPHPTPRRPLELWPPPRPMTEPGDPPWRERWERAESLANDAGIALVRPAVVPWSRKAAELCLFAAEEGVDAWPAVFGAFLLEGRDIGRVDVLVDVAVGLGLELSKTKAVLDIDQWARASREAGAEAIAAGISAPPALFAGGEWLEGFHNAAAMGTFLARTSTR